MIWLKGQWHEREGTKYLTRWCAIQSLPPIKCAWILMTSQTLFEKLSIQSFFWKSVKTNCKLGKKNCRYYAKKLSLDSVVTNLDKLMNHESTSSRKSCLIEMQYVKWSCLHFVDTDWPHLRIPSKQMKENRNPEITKISRFGEIAFQRVSLYDRKYALNLKKECTA